MEQLELSYNSGKNVNWYNYFGKQVVSTKVKCLFNIYPNNYTPKYKTQKMHPKNVQND